VFWFQIAYKSKKRIVTDYWISSSHYTSATPTFVIFKDQINYFKKYYAYIYIYIYIHTLKKKLSLPNQAIYSSVGLNLSTGPSFLELLFLSQLSYHVIFLGSLLSSSTFFFFFHLNNTQKTHIASLHFIFSLFSIISQIFMTLVLWDIGWNILNYHWCFFQNKLEIFYYCVIPNNISDKITCNFLSLY
jgi:hypothetical protein